MLKFQKALKRKQMSSESLIGVVARLKKLNPNINFEIVKDKRPYIEVECNDLSQVILPTGFGWETDDDEDVKVISFYRM